MSDSASPRTAACQAPLSMGFSRQVYWSGLPCPPPEDLPDPRIKPASLVSPELQTDSLPLSHQGSRSISSVQFSRSVVSDSLRLHESQHTRPPCPSPTPGVHSNSRPSPSSHLIHCHPLLLLPAIPPSIKVFSNESTLRMRWPKYWSFSFSIIPSKEIQG